MANLQLLVPALQLINLFDVGFGAEQVLHVGQQLLRPELSQLFYFALQDHEVVGPQIYSMLEQHTLQIVESRLAII